MYMQLGSALLHLNLPQSYNDVRSRRIYGFYLRHATTHISGGTRFCSVRNDDEFVFVVHLTSLSMGREGEGGSFDVPTRPHPIFGQQHLGGRLASDADDGVVCPVLVVAGETVLDVLPLGSNLFRVYRDEVEVPSTSLQRLHGRWFGEPEAEEDVEEGDSFAR